MKVFNHHTNVIIAKAIHKETYIQILDLMNKNYKFHDIKLNLKFFEKGIISLVILYLNMSKN